MCKNKKQPELPEDRTVWKSDNQGVKEETFIQRLVQGAERKCSKVVDQQQLVDWIVKAAAGGCGSPSFVYG